MSEWKEVWYELKKYSDLPSGAKKIFAYGSVYHVALECQGWVVASINGMPYDTPYNAIKAYSFSQKRRRVVCEDCGGLGRLFPLKNQNTLKGCHECHGTGKVWEYLV